MNFSIFSGDETMGGAADYGTDLLRDFSIVIDGNYQLAPITDINGSAQMKELLNGKGWIVEQISHVSAAWFPGLSHFSYQVFAVVGSNYTDAQIVSQLKKDLSGYFNISGASVLSAPYTPPAAGGGGGGSGGGGGGVVPYTQTPAAGVTAPAGGSGNFLDNLGLGLGVSTPIVIGAAALLLVLVLKK